MPPGYSRPLLICSTLFLWVQEWWWCWYGVSNVSTVPSHLLEKLLGRCARIYRARHVRLRPLRDPAVGRRPARRTVHPRHFRPERGEKVVDGVRDDHTVVRGHQERDHHTGQASACEHIHALKFGQAKHARKGTHVNHRRWGAPDLVRSHVIGMRAGGGGGCVRHNETQAISFVIIRIRSTMYHRVWCRYMIYAEHSHLGDGNYTH